uniref:Uncharacterized protein n=1 Tax=Graphocephala atropunctata TaxID=36148 RepID=A0A1B6LPQ2_9HEMI
MIKFLVSVLCYFCCVSRVGSAPIIKASGVQWSDPKGTGKGNITLIMVPQESLNSNDSDMIVAVKSDYQIMSQDTQLLNLVVNEKQNDKSNLDGKKKDLPDCVNSKYNEESHNPINDPNTAQYFETEVKRFPHEINKNSMISTVPLDGNRNGINPSDNKHQNYVDDINIFEFLKIANSSDTSQSAKNKLNLSQNTESLVHLPTTRDYLNTPTPPQSTVNIYMLLMNMTDPDSYKFQSGKNYNSSLSQPTERIINGHPLSNIGGLNSSMGQADKNSKPLSIPTSTESNVNIFKFLDLINHNKSGFLFDQESYTSTESTLNIFNFLHAIGTLSENKISNNTQLLEDSNVNTNTSIRVPSKDTFLNEALTMIDNLKQNPSYYKNALKYGVNDVANVKNDKEENKLDSSETKFKDLKIVDLASASDEDETLVKEFEYHGINKKDHSNIDGNSGETFNNNTTDDICESFFIIDSINQTQASMQFTSPKPGQNVDKIVITLEKSLNNETEKKEGSGTVNPVSQVDITLDNNKNLPELTSEVSTTGMVVETSVEVVQSSITSMDVETSVGVVQSSIIEETISAVMLNLTSTPNPSEAISINEQISLPQQSIVASSTEAQSELSTQAYSTEQPNIPSSTEICTTVVIVQCNPTNSNGVFGKIVDMVSDKNKLAEGIKNDGNSLQKAKLAMPTKITLEPKDECDSIFTTKAISTTSKPIDDSNEGGNLEDNDLKLPFAESPMYNNEHYNKGFDILPGLNTSSRILNLVSLQDNSDQMHGRVAKVQNNTVVFHASKKPIVLKSNEKNHVVLNGSIPVKEKGLNSLDINRILKIHFAGKNVVAQQKFRENVASELNCEPTPEVNDSELEPDDEDQDLETQSVSPATQNKEDITEQTTVNLKSTKAQTTLHMKTTTTKIESSSQQYNYDMSTPNLLEETSKLYSTTTESQKTKSQIKTTTNQQQSSDQENVYDIPTSSSSEETSLIFQSSTELQLEESSELLSTRKTTQKPIRLSTKSSVEENLESTTVKTTIKQSLLTQVDKESIETQFDLSTTMTIQSSAPSKDYDSNDEDALHTQKNIPGRGNTKMYGQEAGKITHTPGISTSIYLPTEGSSTLTTLEPKSKQKPDQTCEKSLYIPSNSVKEVIIQIVKFTKKPGKHITNSKSCYEDGARGDMKNILVDSKEVEQTLDKQKNIQELLSSSDVTSNDNIIEKINSKFSNMKEQRFKNPDKIENNLDSYLIKQNDCPDVDSKHALNAKRCLDNGQDHLSKQETILNHINELNKDITVCSENRFSSSMSKLLKVSDLEIKNV